MHVHCAALRMIMMIFRLIDINKFPKIINQYNNKLSNQLNNNKVKIIKISDKLMDKSIKMWGKLMDNKFILMLMAGYIHYKK